MGGPPPSHLVVIWIPSSDSCWRWAFRRSWTVSPAARWGDGKQRKLYFLTFSGGQNESWVVVSKIFYFHPYLGKILILTNIFQMGWNHQLGIWLLNLNLHHKLHAWLHRGHFDGTQGIDPPFGSRILVDNIGIYQSAQSWRSWLKWW